MRTNIEKIEYEMFKPDDLNNMHYISTYKLDKQIFAAKFKFYNVIKLNDDIEKYFQFHKLTVHLFPDLLFITMMNVHPLPIYPAIAAIYFKTEMPYIDFINFIKTNFP